MFNRECRASWIAFVVCLVTHVLCLGAKAQESVRDLTRAQNGKFLTPNQLDRWLFEGRKGETIVAHVTSTEFDPVLGLARANAQDKQPLVGTFYRDGKGYNFFPSARDQLLVPELRGSSSDAWLPHTNWA